MATTSRDRIDKAIKRAHPAGRYEDPDLALWDEHLPRSRLRALFEKVNQIPFTRADLELADAEMDRSHVLHVGVHEAPSWHEFNRELSERARLAALREQAGRIIYWNIQISRVGPFWTGYWNVFEKSGGRIVPVFGSPPPSFEWSTIIGRTQEVLESFGLVEVDEETLDAPLPWLATAQAYILEERGRPPHPTVQHGLFSDLC